MIVTIDGFAKSGKSAAAEGLAKALDYVYLNTGAMYRAAALQILRHGYDIYDEDFHPATMTEFVQQFHFDITPNQIFLQGTDVTAFIGDESVGKGASVVGTIPLVREHLKFEQKRIVKEWFGKGVNGVVSEGRDQGSVVFPEAPVKFYFWASVLVRAKRMAKAVDGPVYNNWVKQLVDRDTRDTQRTLDPLCPAHMAICIDNSDKTIEEIIADMVGVVKGIQKKR